MNTILVILSVLINIFYLFGSINNGYSFYEVMPGFVFKTMIELYCLYKARRNYVFPVFILIGLWGVSAIFALFYAFLRAKSSADRFGLIGVAFIMFIMSYLVCCIRKQVGDQTSTEDNQ